MNGLAAGEAPDLAVDGHALAKVDLASRAPRPVQMGDAGLSVSVHRPEEIHEGNVGEVTGERGIPLGQGLQALALASLKQSAGPCHHLLEIERLAEKIVGARLHAAHLALDGQVGEEYERDGRSVRALLEASTELETIHALAELGVRDDEVRLLRGEAGQGFHGIAGGPDVEARVAQAEIEDPACLLVAIHDEDPPTPRFLVRSRFHERMKGRVPSRPRTAGGSAGQAGGTVRASICAPRRAAN